MNLPRELEGWTFDDVRLDIERPFFPDIVETTDNCFLVTSGGNASGRAYLVDPRPDFPAKPVQVGFLLNAFICSPRSSRTMPPTLVAATRIASAPFWTQGETRVGTFLNPSHVVSSVAITADGTRAYLGTGVYQLAAGVFSQAGIELTAVQSPVESMVKRYLPGSTTDQILLDEERSEIYAVTGSRAQTSGHLCLLTADHLDYIDFVDTSFAMCTAAVLLDRKVLLGGRRSLEMRDRNDIREARHRDLDAEVFAAARVGKSNLVVLSTGEVIDDRLGSRGFLQMPEETTGMTATRSGGIAAISNQGVLRVWRNPSPE